MKTLLGNLFTLLRSPDIDTAGGGANGATVSSSPGKSTGAAPVADNFYADSPTADGKITGAGGGDTGAGEDFTDKSNQGTKIGNEEPTEQADGTTDATADTPIVEKVAPQPTLKLDAESIAALREAVLPRTTGQQQQQKQLSAAELKEMLSPVEVTPELLQGMGFAEITPEQIAGFQNFANATVKNSVAITRVLISQARKEFEAALGPLMQHHESTQIQNTEQSFYAANKDLEKYKKIVQVEAHGINPKKPDGSFKTEKEIMNEVATNARATLKEMGITISTPANPGAAGGTQVPKPNQRPAAGRSGGDTNGQRGQPNDADADIYNRNR